MATTKARVTTAAVVRAARLRYGRTARLEEKPKAVAPAERARRIARLGEIRDRLKELPGPMVGVLREWRSLIKAAQFVRDVNGDHPSVPKLVETLAASEALSDKLEEREALEAERKRLDVGLHRHRFEILTTAVHGGFGFQTIEASADTLPELLAKIERSATSPGTEGKG